MIKLDLKYTSDIIAWSKLNTWIDFFGELCSLQMRFDGSYLSPLHVGMFRAIEAVNVSTTFIKQTAKPNKGQ